MRRVGEGAGELRPDEDNAAGKQIGLRGNPSRYAKENLKWAVSTLRGSETTATRPALT